MRDIRTVFRQSARRIAVAFGKDVRFPVQVRVPVLGCGNDDDWQVAPEGFGPGAVVYSFGVGEDIGFDLSLIARFGVTVHAFDPTPKSIAWVKGQAVPARFVLHEVGIAAFDGRATFFPPKNPRHVSHTMLDRAATRSCAITVEVRRLTTLMGELGHDRVDLLKMDIEGAEYEVLEDILRSDIPVGQLLVEFHHRFPGVGVAKTRRAVEQLNAAGYRIFAAAASGKEYGFIRPGRARAAPAHVDTV